MYSIQFVNISITYHNIKLILQLTFVHCLYHHCREILVSHLYMLSSEILSLSLVMSSNKPWKHCTERSYFPLYHLSRRPLDTADDKKLGKCPDEVSYNRILFKLNFTDILQGRSVTFISVIESCQEFGDQDTTLNNMNLPKDLSELWNNLLN